MTQVSKITEQGYTARKPRQSRSPILNFGAMLLKNPDTVRKFRVMGPDEERYVRPPRAYELPEYREGMPHCTSKEPYLRPTRWCNPREPEVIAMANELGAYELSDYDFAEAAYWWVKSNMLVEMRPFDSVSATMMRGTGTCYHTISVWIALCRAAGIKARYKAVTIKYPEDVPALQTPELQVFNTGSTPEAAGEVYVDGKWVFGHVAAMPEMGAYMGFHISSFGEDQLMRAAQGTPKLFESIPLRLGIAMGVLPRLAPATLERLNIYFASEVLLKGRKIIEEAGGMEAYNRMARERLSLPSPTIEAREDTALVFEA